MKMLRANRGGGGGWVNLALTRCLAGGLLEISLCAEHSLLSKLNHHSPLSSTQRPKA